MNLYQPRFAHLAEIERRRIPPTPAEALRLHRLERPEPWEAELVEEIWRTQPPINFYPDYAAFHAKLAAFADVSPDRLVIGAGIEGLIRDLFILCVVPRYQVVFTWPTCAMFDIYAQVFGALAVHVTMDPDAPPSMAEIIGQVREGTKLVILPNPGQPVETSYEADDIIGLAHHCRHLGAVLAVDEAYHGFGAPTAIDLVGVLDNLIVLRTFSKAFGAAAIRVGYAVGQRRLVRPLDAIRMSGEIAGPSLHAASVLMDRHETHVLPGINAVCDGRDWLRRQLAVTDVPVRGTVANHVLLDMFTAERAASIGARLWDRGVRVKFGFPAPVDRHLLVTCGPRPLMERFLHELGEAWA